MNMVRVLSRPCSGQEQVATVVACKRDEVVFTSGATESNNLAILLLKEHGLALGKNHVVTSLIEHKAVFEPFDELERLGFAVTRLPVSSGGFVSAAAVEDALRPETLLVSVMQVNNETGVRQPVDQIAVALGSRPQYLHTDAAQGFGRILTHCVIPQSVLISISGHKVYAPKGVGALTHPPAARIRACPASAAIFWGRAGARAWTRYSARRSDRGAWLGRRVGCPRQRAQGISLQQNACGSSGCL